MNEQPIDVRRFAQALIRGKWIIIACIAIADDETLGTYEEPGDTAAGLHSIGLDSSSVPTS